MSSKQFKILGSEPAALIGLIELFLALLLSLHVVGLNQHSIGWIMAVVMAAFGVLQAYVTHHGLYSAIMALIKAGIALGVGYGAPLNDTQVAAIIGFSAAALGIVLRATNSSMATALTLPSLGAPTHPTHKKAA